MKKKPILIVLVVSVFILWSGFVLAYSYLNIYRQEPYDIVSPSPAKRYPTPEVYSCPESNYIDCMPTVESSRAYQCSTQYIEWAEKNCPNFKGVAY